MCCKMVVSSSAEERRLRDARLELYYAQLNDQAAMERDVDGHSVGLTQSVALAKLNQVRKELGLQVVQDLEVCSSSFHLEFRKLVDETWSALLIQWARISPCPLLLVEAEA